jgi:dimethylargininase
MMRSVSATDLARGIALVRRPGPRLAEGQVAVPRPQPVDLDRAREQHARYRDVLAAAGWRVVEVPPADEHPDAVFVEDTAIVVGDRVVLTRPGHPSRTAEVASVAGVLSEMDIPAVELADGCRLDGGDVLSVGRTVYIGLSDRTDAAATDAVAALLDSDGWRVRRVSVTGCLHLKSAVTALPDGTLFGVPAWVDTTALPAPVLPAPEPAGADLLLLGGDRVGVSAAAPRTAELLSARGLDPVPLDLTEFEAVDAGPTCLSILLPEAVVGVRSPDGGRGVAGDR